MEETLANILRVLGATSFTSGDHEIDADAQRALKSLGYLGGK
jgi:hypothetical protein